MPIGVKIEPVRCPECRSDPNVRARLLAEVVITPAGYDVWTVSRRRREQTDPDPGADDIGAYEVQ